MNRKILIVGSIGLLVVAFIGVNLAGVLYAQNEDLIDKSQQDRNQLIRASNALEIVSVSRTEDNTTMIVINNALDESVDGNAYTVKHQRKDEIDTLEGCINGELDAGEAINCDTDINFPGPVITSTFSIEYKGNTVDEYSCTPSTPQEETC